MRKGCTFLENVFNHPKQRAISVFGLN
uniref:Uncharacterized protein n=1 Tax=Anguilla anguilla TaxID=7936 RepID=A0A0E9S3Z7_ANGAN